MTSNQESPAEFVTLASNDGFEFVIPRSAACVSGTLRRMLEPSSNFSEAVTGRCVLETLNGVVLEKVCEYLLYNERNKGQTNVPDMDIPPELCLELLMAADYLDSQLFLFIFLLCSPNPLN
ncbi:Transcriptional elongation regulator [Trichophyton interdigitale]|uniref:E3 ubiquitin ligase complex SCF subunit sconC n=1 Tax=Trichophyton interdigitale TaxID=101480 RepID=A0A9P4YKH4_9EURO|nr:Transcriptional elongation regulator [Trichophyton interdigitale]KAF3900028.1 Transcriptional elongation regulator [Trichophyton interdigitale]KAG8211152.1 Transcriptional elongation regulator [Trichophyton interdigitale]